MQHNSPALVAVYCGSRLGNQPSYIDSAKQLGDRMAEAGLGLVYGGASIGLCVYWLKLLRAGSKRTVFGWITADIGAFWTGLHVHDATGRFGNNRRAAARRCACVWGCVRGDLTTGQQRYRQQAHP